MSGVFIITVNMGGTGSFYLHLGSLPVTGVLCSVASSNITSSLWSLKACVVAPEYYTSAALHSTDYYTSTSTVLHSTDYYTSSTVLLSSTGVLHNYYTSAV